MVISFYLYIRSWVLKIGHSSRWATVSACTEDIPDKMANRCKYKAYMFLMKWPLIVHLENSGIVFFDVPLNVPKIKNYRRSLSKFCLLRWIVFRATYVGVVALS